MLWAMEGHRHKSNKKISGQVRALRQGPAEFSAASKRAVGLLGPVLLWPIAHDERLLADGVAHESKMVAECRNWATDAF